MAAISDYGSLLVDVGEYVGRNDFAHLFGRFVGLAETGLNRVLRVSDMETEAQIPLTDGEGALPADFIEAREVRYLTYAALRAWPLQSLKNRYQSGGVPQGYAVIGNEITVRPMIDGNLSVIYWAKLPGLSVSSPTNWLLDRAPDVYLAAVVQQVAIWAKDAALAQAVGGMLSAAIDNLHQEDHGRQMSNARVVVGGNTP